MKGYIDTYSTMYDIDIVIANKDVTIEELREFLTYSDGVELEDSLLNYSAVTSTCRNKKTNKYCILVKFNKHPDTVGLDKKLDMINAAAHEALHVAMDIFDACCESVDPKNSNESLAYLVGWLTEKIYSTWTKK